MSQFMERQRLEALVRKELATRGVILVDKDREREVSNTVAALFRALYVEQLAQINEGSNDALVIAAPRTGRIHKEEGFVFTGITESGWSLIEQWFAESTDENQPRVRIKGIGDERSDVLKAVIKQLRRSQ